MNQRRPAPAGRRVVAVVTMGLGLGGLGLAAAGCGSGPGSRAVATGASTTLSTPPTTGPVLVPTVPNCGGGAFEPKTLLIVCGTGTTTATGVAWATWDQSGASGSGLVNLKVDGRTVTAPASLTLRAVVVGPAGPQFSLLTVTWTGRSPDGRPQDSYHLQLGG